MDKDPQRGRPLSRSQNQSRPASKVSSRTSSRSSSGDSLAKKEWDNDKTKGTFSKGTKSPKKVKNQSQKGRSSSGSGRSSGPSGYATPMADEYDSDASGNGGLDQPMANLQYALHTVLTNKGREEQMLADQLLKGDANKKLREALKRERVKGAQMFASLMDGGPATTIQDVPHFKPFNKRNPPCSPEEFDRHLKAIMRNFTRFEGRCAEFLYFLIELEVLRNTANITDEQLIRVLQNRLAGRLRKYFRNEMNRDKNVVEVLNRIGCDYVEVVDVAAEIEKCANFKFKFNNITDELVKLKEIMSLAYPHLPTQLFRETYVQKIIDMLPSQIRLEAVEVFEKQREREKQGFKPLQDHEIMEKIANLCKVLESKQKKLKD